MDPMLGASRPYVIAIIIALVGLYEIWAGIRIFRHRDIKGRLYDLGARVSIILYGESRIAKFERGMQDPKTAAGYAVLLLCLGFSSLGLAVFLILTA